MKQRIDWDKTFKAVYTSLPHYRDYHLFVFRNDGIILYQNSPFSDISAIGALMGGVWQAAEALKNFIPNQKEEREFRLSYDTSDQGIYVLPVNNNGEQYFLGTIYFDQVNPAVLKQRVRELSFKLGNFIISKPTEKKTKEDDKRNGFLFNDISDAEIDGLFNFTGN